MYNNEGTIFTVIVFPRPWPPSHRLELFSREEEGSGIRIIADTQGRYIFDVYSPDRDPKQYRFQPIILEGSGRALLSVSWSEQGASLRLNSREIMLDEDVNGEPLILKTKDDPLPIDSLILGDIRPEKSNTEAEYLFLATVNDIDQKVYAGGRYNLIKAAGLLRQLFLDSSPLIHVVNRNYRIKFEFETIDYRSQPPLMPEAHRLDLDGLMFPEAKRIKVNLDDFLKAPCFTLDGVTATVKDLIRACANAKGGVHFGSAKTSKESSILDWDRTFKIVGEEPSLATIKGVCRVSLKALKPLVEKVINSA